MDRFMYVTYINTTPEELWKALTDPEFTQQYWWGRRLESDWKVGSEIKAVYEGGKIDWQGKIIEYKPSSILSFSFHLEGKPDLKADRPSTVTYKIEPAGQKIVKFTVTHDNLSEKGYRDVSQGWPALLSSLKTLAEAGRALEYAS